MLNCHWACRGDCSAFNFSKSIDKQIFELIFKYPCLRRLIISFWRFLNFGPNLNVLSHRKLLFVWDRWILSSFDSFSRLLRKILCGWSFDDKLNSRFYLGRLIIHIWRLFLNLNFRCLRSLSLLNNNGWLKRAVFIFWFFDDYSLDTWYALMCQFRIWVDFPGSWNSRMIWNWVSIMTEICFSITLFWHCNWFIGPDSYMLSSFFSDLHWFSFYRLSRYLKPSLLSLLHDHLRFV